MFMPTASVVVALGHGSQSALGHIGMLIAHAVIYSTVARMIWHAPLLLVAFAVAAACAFLLVQYARRDHE